MRNIVIVAAVLIGLMINDLEGKVKKPNTERVPGTKMMVSLFNIIPEKPQEKSTPLVKLHLSRNDDENLTWGDFVRYTIEVSDEVDGDSKYGEIMNNKVLLEIEFLPIKDQKDPVSTQKQPNPEGLSLMMGSTCFACHADKEVLTGPSFSEIADRYGKKTDNVAFLANHILKGSSGQWGNMEMPAHPNLTVEETEKIAAFILKQGSRKNHRIVPGMEGTFQVMEKPSNLTQGVLILTASYTSSSMVKGQHRITLPIK